jgi:CheY-like chemotaxis protein
MNGITTSTVSGTKDSWENNMQVRILVVDDDPTVCELIQAVLSSVEINSLTLTSSKAAIPYLSKEKFSAIFLDVRMPAPDGIELTRQIRSSGLNRTTPIAIITGEEDRSVLARAFDAGASFFLFKPIDRHRMLRLIRVSEGPVQLEARRYQRVRIQCHVSLECGERNLSGTTLDLSLNGFSVQGSAALPVGSAVSASLQLKSNAPPVRLGARVVRAFGDGCMGLQIEHATAEESRRLQEFLLPIILAKADS